MVHLRYLRELLVSLWFLSLAVSFVAGDAVDDLAATALTNVHKILNGSVSDGASRASCTKDTLAYRREL